MEGGRRALPSVDRVLLDKRLEQIKERHPHDLMLSLVRQAVDDFRHGINEGSPAPSLDAVIESVLARVYALDNPGLRPVINATGVILHTNLGRASLSPEAIAAMDEAARGYCNLEFDLESGGRGSRNDHIEPVLCQLCGAEAALVVNNNAAAVLFALTVLARRKEVIVSRSQAVEIGGGFRIPAVMRQSGAKLVEVGTTNCTYIADYEQAISPRTAALMRVHSSNFKLVGFTHDVELEELVVLGRRYDLPVFDDLGSGCFLDTGDYGLDPEPVVQRSIAAGAGLVMFSGDKLLGGPQAGVIAGEKELVDRLRRHPLARALRIDKVRLAGLLATLIHYVKDEAVQKIPLWRIVSAPLEEIEQRAGIWADAAGGSHKIVDGESMVGGGSLPGGTLPTRLVALGSGGKGGTKGQELAYRLRRGQPPVIGRISGNALLLDPRTVLPEEDEAIIRALRDLGLP